MLEGVQRERERADRGQGDREGLGAATGVGSRVRWQE
jgi:hypothetical protein